MIWRMFWYIATQAIQAIRDTSEFNSTCLGD